MDEAAAWRELEAAVDAALWRYAEAVTGQPRAVVDGGPGVPGLSAPVICTWRGWQPHGGLHATLDAADRSAAAR